MLLTDLPEEVLVLIIKQLDFTAQNSLYNTCKLTRHLVCLQGITKSCEISKNWMATSMSLKEPFFKEVSHHILELNMCGVPDLCKTSLLLAIKRLKQLKGLDVSYTNIHILDLMDIQKACPTLKDITIDLSFGKSQRVCHKTLEDCQTLFANFENIHFYGSIGNLLYSMLGVFLTTKAKLKNLKFSATENDTICYVVHQELLDGIKFAHFDNFCMYLLPWQNKGFKLHTEEISIDTYPSLLLLDFKENEFFVILIEELKPKVYGTHVFNNFFKETFNITVEYIEPTSLKFFGNAAFMLWNRERTNFDDQFFQVLMKRLKQFFPYYFLLYSKLHEVPAPTKYDWFYTIPTPYGPEKHTESVRKINKKRQAVPNFVLNYDVIFREKDKVELSLIFRYPMNIAITLSPNCEYLKKLTFLSLFEIVRFTPDFFSMLFTSCKNLVTLSVHALPVSTCASAIAKSLPLSKSVKNIRLIDKRIDFNAIFTSFSTCPTLENLHIVDESILEYNSLGDPSEVVKNCVGLYSVYIRALVNGTVRTKTIQMFNKAKSTYNRHCLNFRIGCSRSNPVMNYDPFLEIFRVNPIRPV